MSSQTVSIETRRLRMRQFGLQFAGIASFLAALIVAFSALSGDFFKYDNGVIILSNAAVIGVVALGQTLVIISGGFDLSVAGVAPLSAVIFAKLVNSGVPIVPAIVIALAAGALVGLLNGLIVTVGKIDPLITTLGTLSITGGLALTLASGQSIPIEDLSAGFLAEAPLLEIPNQVWLMIGAAVLVALILRFTAYGRALYALGGNAEAARLAGIRVGMATTSAYVASGGLAAVGGVVLASQLLAGDGTLGSNIALTSITAVVLGGGALTGGVGGAGGTIAGVMVLGVLANGLTLLQVSSFYQQMVTGAVLLLAVGFSRLRSKFSQ